MADLIKTYTADCLMRQLIRHNSSMLMVLSRFDIPLGFGDKTVAETCNDNNVDVPTFLAVANFISGNPFEPDNIDVAALTDYLRRAHSYFLDFCLPNIRSKLLASLDCSGINDLSFIILRFFDEYVAEVRTHMEYENDTVFQHIKALLKGQQPKGFAIKDFTSHHKRIESKLNELKDILIRYCPARNHNLLNSALFDIINIEQDLESHCSVEDRLLVPAVLKLEINNASLPTKSPDLEETAIDTTNAVDNLSNREKEIITAIALGMSNKEIADKFCISVHTATTHRRNIFAKLGIHSVAGLTIFAIINHLVDVESVKRLK